MTGKYFGVEVDNSDGEDSDLIVCPFTTEPLLLPDNVVSLCHKCVRLVQHRPHIPKRPKLICMDCVMLIEEVLRGQAQFVVSSKTIEEVAEHLKRKAH